MKPYTWDEIKNFLVNELNNSKHIMTWGTIGSCNIEHDIDTIITKKPSSPSSLFYKEVHCIFDALESYLRKKHGANLLRFPGGWQAELINLSQSTSKDLVIESMIYTTYPQIQADWGWSLFEDSPLKNLFKSYQCLLGSTQDLFSKSFQKSKYSDPIFIYLYRYDRIHSHYPKNILMKIANHNYDYLYRKRLGLSPPQIKNEKQLRDYFYMLCDILDELDSKKDRV